MAANIIENFKNFEIFDFSKGVKKKSRFFRYRENFCKYKGVIFELTAKSQFLLNYIGYFSKNWQKSASIFRGFSSISPKVMDINPRKSLWYLLLGLSYWLAQ